ncbi:MAG TPA: AAA family ATPase [Methylomirabilota bacterium]|jgi:DNA-binding SARP family transcriptional activator
MGDLHLTLLGGFELRTGARPVTIAAVKTRALLAVLALGAGRAHGREALATLLWGGHGERRARQSLRQALFRLRQALGGARRRGLTVRGRTVTLDRVAVDVDVARFERLARRRGRPALEAAVALYRGPLLDGLAVDEPAFDEWLQPERVRLHDLARDTLLGLLRDHTARRRSVQAAATAGQLLALDPLQEDVHRALMRLYARQGRRDAALRQYQACVEVLRRELGVEPDGETKRLYQDLLQQGVGRAAPGRTGDVHAETALIGRQAELGRLRAALTEAARGRGRLVLVTGETGVGKSRLVEEVVAEAGRRALRVLFGRCHETERVLPFRPWIDAFRAGHVLAEVKRLRDPNAVWIAELGRLFPELTAAGPALPADSEGHVRLFDVMADVIAHAAAGAPLVIVLEDVHWADDMSLRLLSFLARRLAERPVLVVATAREEDLDAAPVLGRVVEELSRETHCSRLTLAPLSRPDTAALVRTLVRRGSSNARIGELAGQAWTLSEGNPLVIVETMRALLEGRLKPVGDGWPLPQAVREVILWRLDRLSVRARQLAAVAATIGREFSFSLLQRAAGLGERDTAEGVEELVRGRLLRAVGDRLDFTHHRVRDVAYDAAAPPRRLALHGAVGRALETLAADRLDDVCDQLARHFSLADEPGRALRFLLLVADKAARSYALDEAVRTLREAHGLVERLTGDEGDRRRVDVAFRLVHVLSLLGRVPDALDLLRKEETRIERLHDPAVSGRYHFWLAYSHDLLADSARAVQHAQRSVQEAARCGDQVTMGQANYVLARESYYGGRPLQGVAYGRQAVSMLQATPEAWWLGQSLIVLALNLFHLGDFTPALAELARVADLSRSIGDRRLQAFGASMAGWVHALRGEYDAALTSCRSVLMLAPDTLTRAVAAGYLGAAYLESGDALRAIPVLEETARDLRVMAGAGARRYRQVESYFTSTLAEAYARSGRLDTARAMATSAAATAHDSSWLVAVGYAERALGVIAGATGEPARAAESFDRSIEAFTTCEARYHAARAHLLRAEVAHTLDDRAAVTTHLRAAHDAFRLLHVSAWVQRAQEAGRRLGVDLG